MGIKKGTKLTDNPKLIHCQVRMDEETARKLSMVCERRKMNKSELIRDLIALSYMKLG